MESTFEREIESALRLYHPHRTRLLRRGVPASVLVLFAGFEADVGLGSPRLLFTLRTHRVETHKGQISFPGGIADAGETAEAAALREAFEEVGIPPENVRVLGRLPRLPTSTGFLVTPVVGVSRVPIERIGIRLNTDEVDSVIWASWQEVQAPGVYRRESIPVGELRFMTHAFLLGRDRVWGVTAAILRNLVERVGSGCAS